MSNYLFVDFEEKQIVAGKFITQSEVAKILRKIWCAPMIQRLECFWENSQAVDSQEGRALDVL